MQGSDPATQTDSGLPDSSEVVTEETPAASDEVTRLPDEPTAPQEATDPAQGTKPKGDDPAKPPETDAAARRNDPVKRIDKLTRRLRETERKLAYAEGRLSATEQARGSSAAATTVTDDTPRLDDYDSAQDFAEALADYYQANPDKRPSRGSGKQPTSGEPAAPTANQREPAPEAGAPSEVQVKSYIAAKAKFSDLDDVLLDSSLPWTKFMADAVAEDEDSAEILYQLGQNEAELERISKLSPKQQEHEVWRFAETYRAGRSPAADSPAQPDTDADDPDAEPRATEQPGARVSKAAPVPPPIGGSGSASRNPADLPQGEYEAVMNARDKARRR